MYASFDVGKAATSTNSISGIIFTKDGSTEHLCKIQIHTCKKVGGEKSLEHFAGLHPVRTVESKQYCKLSIH